ncbi:hypothetical protein [Actinomadura sp. WMMB 499]|uniref:hypothetical protein n=1 Tax=Actinomadura sp. WMMB 499 TaxID=1219491 RepID=UPI0012490221|nr:hypothetical protein [Actinomadura sp. WMMB 499]QFG21576.1 hypothetical protein F7P10_10950 [Actinomadura sp. WMMB 499]
MTGDRVQSGRDGQTDHETEQYAQDLQDAIRSLKRAVSQPRGIAGPVTVNAVLDAVHAAATGFDQLLLQIERCLTRQHMDGHLAHDQGASLDEALDAFGQAVLHARNQGAGCGEAVNQARSAISGVQSRDQPFATSAPTSRDTAAGPAPAAPTQRAEQRVKDESKGLRARWFGNSRRGA